MADSYPSVGMKMDLTDLVKGQVELRNTKQAFNEVGDAATNSAAKVEAAGIKMDASFRTRSAMTKQQFGEETAARAQATATQDRIAADSLAMNLRMSKQRADEADRAAKAEVRAAAEAASQQEKARLYLQGVKMTSMKWEEDAATRLAAAEVRAATASANEQGRLADYVQRLKIRYFTQTQAAQEKAEQAGVTAAERAATKLASQQASFLGQLEKRNVEQTNTTAGQRAYLELKAAQLGVTEAAKPMIEGLHATEQALGHVSGQAIKVREAFVLIREFMRGDFSRMAGSASILAGAFGALKPAILPFTLGLLAVTAVIAGYIAAVNKMETENSKLANALAVTNDAVGLTSANIMGMAKTLSDANSTSLSKTVDLLTKLAATGEVSGSSLRTVADASLQLARLTGESADKIGNELIKSFNDASKGAIDLNNRFHFLTLAEYEQIDALQRAGDKQGAFNALMTDLDTHLHTVTPQVGTFAKIWDQVTKAIDNAVRALGNLGVAQDNAAKLAADQKRVAEFDKNPFSRNSPQAKAVRDRLAVEVSTAAQEQRSAYDQAGRDKTNTEQIDTHAYLQQTLPSLGGSDTRAQDEINIFHQKIANGDPNDPLVQDARANMAKYELGIRKKYDKQAFRHPRTDGLNGARNTQAGQQGQISGLRNEIFAASDQDPLSVMVAQVEKARATAEGQYSNGKKTVLQQQAIENAGNKEALTLIAAMTNAIGKRTRAEQDQLAIATIQRQADDDAFGAMQRYYQGTDYNLTTYLSTLDQVADIQLKAKNSEAALQVAQQFGLTSTSEISDALVSRKLATKDVADAVQGLAEEEVKQIQKTNSATDANQRQTESQKLLKDALTASFNQQRDLDKVQRQAGLTPLDRSAQSKVEVDANLLILEAKKQGIILTNQEAEAMVRVKSVMDQQLEDLAKMKTGIQDSIRQTFIDTGKLDFKSLKDGVGKAIRQAVYDNLLAKPITIVVNAVMNIATEAIQSLIQRVLGTVDGGGGSGGGILSSIASLFGAGKGVGVPSYANDDYAAAAAEAAGSLGQASSGLARAASSLGGLGSILSTAVIGSSIGGISNSLFGLKNNTGSAIGGALGGLGGLAVGSAIGGGVLAAGAAGGSIGTFLGLSGAALGPIGMVVGAILGAALGSILGGKPSNFTASGMADGGGGFLYGGDKPNADTSKAAQALGGAITQSMQALLQAGITPTESVTGFEIGQRDTTKVKLSDGTVLQSAVGDPTAAANGAMIELLRTANYANDAEKTFVQGLIDTGTAFDNIIASLQKFDAAQAFGKGIGRSILQYTDPQSYALANLGDQQNARIKQLQSYGAQGLLSPEQVSTFAKQLQTLDALELADTMKQFTTGVNAATHSLADFQSEQKKIKDFVTGLSSGALSPLSPADKLAYDQGLYSSDLTKAQGGDFTALSNITSDAQSYLGDAQSFYGSTSAYNDIFNQVQSQLSGLGNQTFTDPVVSGLGSVQDAVVQNGVDVVNAINAANAALLAQLAAGTTAVVQTTSDGLTALVQSNVDATSLTVALSGGVASVPGVSSTPTMVETGVVGVAAGGGGAGRFDGGMLQQS